MQQALLFLSLFLLGASGTAFIYDPFPNLKLNRPVDIANDGTSSRLYAVQQAGRIVVWDSTDQEVSQATVFLDITGRVVSGGEQGLLGLAFHPNYANNGYFYVYYTNPGTVVSRFTATGPLTANPASELILLTVPQPFTNHNGGCMKFWNGYLFIGLGDGGSGGDPQNHGQATADFLGKILRIDVDNPSGGKQYGIPGDNPFVGNAAFFPEIFAYGVRNPWRFSFDIETGELFAGDVGQGDWEEVSIIPRGGNMGWKVMEGFHCYGATTCDRTGKILPIHEYSHANGDVSITGGYVFRGKTAPELVGKYVFADYESGRVWVLTYDVQNPSANSAELMTQNSTWKISTFGVDVDQSLYFADLSSGKIYKFGSDSSANPGAVLNIVLGFFLLFLLF